MIGNVIAGSISGQGGVQVGGEFKGKFFWTLVLLVPTEVTMPLLVLTVTSLTLWTASMVCYKQEEERR